MSKRILAMVATGFVFVLVSNAILSNLPSHIFSSASGQEESNKNILNNNTNNNRGNSIQSIIDERTAQALENAKKLRKVSGEYVPNQYIVVLKDRGAITPSTSSVGFYLRAICRRGSKKSRCNFTTCLRTCDKWICRQSSEPTSSR